MIGFGLVRMKVFRKQTGLVVVVFTTLLFASTAFGFSITHLDTAHQGSEFKITMAADLALTEDVIDALQSNIDITITMQVKIYRVRENLWDVLVADTVIDYTLSASNVYRGYSVRSSDRQLDTIHNSIDDALDTVGSERTYKIVIPENQSEEPDARYRGKCRIFLDRSKLPSVVSTTVRFKKSWKRTSGWSEFVL